MPVARGSKSKSNDLDLFLFRTKCDGPGDRAFRSWLKAVRAQHLHDVIVQNGVTAGFSHLERDYMAGRAQMHQTAGRTPSLFLRCRERVVKIATREKLAFQQLSDDWIAYNLCPKRA